MIGAGTGVYAVTHADQYAAVAVTYTQDHTLLLTWEDDGSGVWDICDVEVMDEDHDD